MGDIADYLIEQGEEEYYAHQSGKCLEQCSICEEEYLKKQERQRKRDYKRLKSQRINKL